MSEPPVLTLEIFTHMDAVPREGWTHPDIDARPLTEVGWQQAERVAEVILAKGPVDALLSSPALRATQSLEPLSKRTGLPIVVIPGFDDTFQYRAPSGWEPERPGQSPLGGAYAGGKALAELNILLKQDGIRRAILSSYEDVVPAFLAVVAGLYGVDMPPRMRDSRLRDKGYFYVLKIDGDTASLWSESAPPGFPQRAGA